MKKFIVEDIFVLKMTYNISKKLKILSYQHV